MLRPSKYQMSRRADRNVVINGLADAAEIGNSTMLACKRSWGVSG
jgi:hypothetical protein